MTFNFIPVKTRVVRPPHDEIWDIIDGLEVMEGDVVFITSKILGLHEGRTARIEADGSAAERQKEELIRREASSMLPFTQRAGFRSALTITQNVLIPSAGIDESNADGYYVMWPSSPDELCREIRERLCGRLGLKNLGVVATDSNVTPLRWGVTGIAIGLAGVEPLEDLRGKKDIFGRPMTVTPVSRIDALTGMATLLMGEAADTKPIVILRGYKEIVFNEKASMTDMKIAPEDDMYEPMLKVLMKEY